MSLPPREPFWAWLHPHADVQEYRVDITMRYFDLFTPWNPSDVSAISPPEYDSETGTLTVHVFLRDPEGNYIIDHEGRRYIIESCHVPIVPPWEGQL